MAAPRAFLTRPKNGVNGRCSAGGFRQRVRARKGCPEPRRCLPLYRYHARHDHARGQGAVQIGLDQILEMRRNWNDRLGDQELKLVRMPLSRTKAALQLLDFIWTKSVVFDLRFLAEIASTSVH